METLFIEKRQRFRVFETSIIEPGQPRRYNNVISFLPFKEAVEGE